MISAKDISTLINKNKWDKILRNLKDGHIKPNTVLANGNLITHMASANNKSDIISHLIE